MHRCGFESRLTDFRLNCRWISREKVFVAVVLIRIATAARLKGGRPDRHTRAIPGHLAQQAERRPYKPEVLGSNPRVSTTGIAPENMVVSGTKPGSVRKGAGGGGPHRRVERSGDREPVRGRTRLRGEQSKGTPIPVQVRGLKYTALRKQANTADVR